MTLDCMTSSSLRNFSNFIFTALSVSTKLEDDEAIESRCNLDRDSTFSVVRPKIHPEIKQDNSLGLHNYSQL